MCAFAGLRRGEAAGVQVGDIDHVRGLLKVSWQLQRERNTFVTRLPKCGSERNIFLPPDLVEILADHIATYMPDPNPEAWLFTVGERPMYDNDIHWQIGRAHV